MESVDKILDALRAVRDTQTNLSGMTAFRKRVLTDGVTFIVLHLRKSPSFKEIRSIWDCQHSVNQPEVLAMLLRAVGEVLAFDATACTEVSSAIDGLASHVIHARMKLLYRHMDSGRVEANLALMLLTAIARRSPALAVLLHDALDFNHKSILKVAKCPKGVASAPGDSDSNVRNRLPCCSYATLVIALLETCPREARCLLLSNRTAMNNLFQAVPALPTQQVQQLLTLFKTCVLDPSAAIPPNVQAAAFGDVALTQLAGLLPVNIDEEAGTMKLVQAAAYEMLLDVASDASHGLCPSSDAQLQETPHSRCQMSGQRRVLRMLQGLNPRSVVPHAHLLAAVVAKVPHLGAAFLASCNWTLEPETTFLWWRGLAVVTQIAVAAAPAQATAAALEVAAAEGRRPPLQSASLRAALDCALPPVLSKASLSQGLQHGSRLVRYGSVCAVASLIQALHPLLQQIQEAINIARTRDESHQRRSASTVLQETLPAVKCSEEAAWQIWAQNLQTEIGTRLPDPQVLSAVVADVEGVRVPEHHKLPRTRGAQGLHHTDPSSQQDLHSQAYILWIQITTVVTGYFRCLPIAMAEARFDAARFLTPDALQQPVARQQAAVAVLQAAGDSVANRGSAGAAAEAALSLTPLLSLLNLVAGSVSAQVRRDAQRLAYLKITTSGATDGFGCTDGEAALWLAAVPLRNSMQPKQAEATEAVTWFLGEAVAVASRRPQEALMLVHKHLTIQLLRTVGDSAVVAGFSVLAVVVLQRALRVATSVRMASASKVAIAEYVAGTLRALLRLQTLPHPFASMLSGLLEHCKAEASMGALHDLLLVAKRVAGGGPALDICNRSAKRTKTSGLTKQMRLHDALDAVIDGRAASVGGNATVLGARTLTLRAAAMVLMQSSTVASVKACSATVLANLEGCNAAEAKLVMGEPRVLASFLKGQGPVAQSRNEAIVAWLSALVPSHPHTCQPYIQRMHARLSAIQGSAAQRPSEGLLHACSHLYAYLAVGSLVQASLQALSVAASSSDVGAAAAALAQAAVAAVQKQPSDGTSYSAATAVERASASTLENIQAQCSLLQGAVAALVAPSAAVLVAVQRFLARLLHSDTHLIRTLTATQAAGLLEACIRSGTPEGGFIAAVVGDQVPLAVAAAGPLLAQALHLAGSHPATTQGAVGIVLPLAVACLQQAKAKAAAGIADLTPTSDTAADITALLQQPMMGYMAGGIREVAPPGEAGTGGAPRQQRMLDACAVTATALLLRAVPLTRPELQQLLARLLPVGGWPVEGGSGGGPPEAAQRISLAASLVFSPLICQDDKAAATAQLATCVVSTYIALAASKMEKQAHCQLEARLLRLLDGRISQRIASECVPNKAAMLISVAAVAAFTDGVLRHRLHSPPALAAATALIGAAASVGSKRARQAIASATAAAFERLVSHSKFLALLMGAPEEQLPSAAARVALPLTSLMSLAEVDEDTADQVDDDASATRVAVAKLAYRLIATLSSTCMLPTERTLHVIRSAVAAVPTLLAAYGATRSCADTALLATLRAIDSLAAAAPAGSRDVQLPPPSMCPLQDAGYLWGTAAVAAHRAGVVGLHNAERAPIVREHATLDPRRLAVSCVSCHPAGYDPYWVLCFAAAAVRDGGLTLPVLMGNGITGLSLRCLASDDGTVREKAVAILQVAATAMEAQSGHGRGDALGDLHHLLPLLPILQAAVAAGPKRQLAAVVALFLAEAATQLANSEAPLHKRFSKLISARPQLSVEEVPMFYGELIGGGPQFSAHRMWLLRIMAVGLQNEADTAVMRRKFVIERLMPLLQSPVADAAARWQALRVVCRAAAVPSCALDLIASSGLLPWLASAAARAMKTASPGGGGQPEENAVGKSAPLPPGSAISGEGAEGAMQREAPPVHHPLPQRRMMRRQERAAVECLAALEGSLSMAPLQRFLSKAAIAWQADSAVRTVITAFTGAISGGHNGAGEAVATGVLRVVVAGQRLVSKRPNSEEPLLPVDQWAILAAYWTRGAHQRGDTPATLLLEALLLASPQQLLDASRSTAGGRAQSALAATAWADVAKWAVEAASRRLPDRWARLAASAGLRDDEGGSHVLPVEYFEDASVGSSAVAQGGEVVGWVLSGALHLTGGRLSDYPCLQPLLYSVAALHAAMPPMASPLIDRVRLNFLEEVNKEVYTHRKLPS